jgi:DNA-binding NtrC family response regulator
MGRLDRCNVLIVEDEVLVALDLETLFARIGCNSVRTAGNLDDALAEIERAPPDLAVVDLNVAGRLSLAVVDRLAGAAIPFLILSGHAPDVLPSDHRHHPFMLKPYDARGLVRRLEQILDGAPNGRF